ncbi:undecaprenyldiphospho-muramoylpentapeptide beta-N-acetylglucosaminyltransferase [Mechercharimyces sp. CAU 1602]|uniref:undecaprenyldiphospho-muramoylpentapeptide beta-N-acetylglucosaminyltransferase n=1 Tax=Mechercharimyces sp. CAU 1602 TaxID=2973933 RepID=UPI0021624074|nr:undecaprenyldiphospho-muramoylpentapeptide beta-N-acetylglucosaminyltransferase [Mechercharimyces sp. CAU 1602]MCS1351101.1 undecaprenyldiphospho-muramoylpentapeptide beta-N-acetylglucosaminyltransferase [Mechercharimyces sp. CAU 1602]
MKTMVMTGGGTAGHVTPNMALIPELKKAGWSIHYIGSHEGMEKDLIQPLGIPYHGISSGKLRRYLDWQNIKDPFKVLKGVFDAYVILRKLKPQMVFSKGGFVSVPVVIASRLLRIPVIIHESDITPGLANKLAVPFATKVCVTFTEAKDHLPKEKTVVTGTPIRPSVFAGDAEQGRLLCGFTKEKPVLMIMGGSLGSHKINESIRANLDSLLRHFQVVHLCGKGHVDESLQGRKGYAQFPYVNEELPHIFAMTDMIVSRAGSNAISEFLALQIPHLLIPLTREQSRGDQILNAQAFERKGYSQILFEEDLAQTDLAQMIIETYEDRHEYIEKMKASPQQQSVDKILHMIAESAKK